MSDKKEKQVIGTGRERFVPPSVRYGGRRARLAWWISGVRESVALRLAPWLRSPCLGADWPQGIDYEKWAPIVQPAPKGTFADPLDLLDPPADPEAQP